MTDGKAISIAPGVIIDYAGTPLAPVPVPTRVLPGAVVSVPGFGVYAKNLPALRGSYSVTLKVSLPPPPIDTYIVLAGTEAVLTNGFVHGLLITKNKTIEAVGVRLAGGPVTTIYRAVTNETIQDDTFVSVTVAWDSQKPLDNGHQVKLRVAGAGQTTTVTDEAPWTPLPLTQLLVGQASPLGLPDYPGWVGRVQWSSRTDVF